MSFKQDAVREWSFNHGAEHPEQAWLLSDFDTWERNPHYTGPDVPHPEDYHAEDEDRAMVYAGVESLTQEEVDEMLYPSDSVPGDGIPF